MFSTAFKYLINGFWVQCNIKLFKLVKVKLLRSRFTQTKSRSQLHTDYMVVNKIDKRIQINNKETDISSRT